YVDLYYGKFSDSILPFARRHLRQLSSPGWMQRCMSRPGCFHVHDANPASASHCCSFGGQMRSTFHKGRQVTKSASIGPRGFCSAAWLFLPLSLLGWAVSTRVLAQQSSPTPMRLTLDQA